jgi:hypothetical protein
MRSRAHKLLLAAAVAGLLLASASCSKSEDVSRERVVGVSRERAVDDAAARFHENFKASKFDEIYAEASKDLCADQNKEEFVERLRVLRERLGEITRIKEALRYGRERDEELDYVSTNFDVEGSEDCTELMFWDVSGGEARLLRYGVMFDDGKESINLTP